MICQQFPILASSKECMLTVFRAQSVPVCGQSICHSWHRMTSPPREMRHRHLGIGRTAALCHSQVVADLALGQNLAVCERASHDGGSAAVLGRNWELAHPPAAPTGSGTYWYWY